MLGLNKKKLMILNCLPFLWTPCKNVIQMFGIFKNCKYELFGVKLVILHNPFLWISKKGQYTMLGGALLNLWHQLLHSTLSMSKWEACEVLFTYCRSNEMALHMIYVVSYHLLWSKRFLHSVSIWLLLVANKLGYISFTNPSTLGWFGS